MFVFSIIFFNYEKSDVTNRVFNKTYNQIFQKKKKQLLRIKMDIIGLKLQKLQFF